MGGPALVTSCLSGPLPLALFNFCRSTANSQRTHPFPHCRRRYAAAWGPLKAALLASAAAPDDTEAAAVRADLAAQQWLEHAARTWERLLRPLDKVAAVVARLQGKPAQQQPLEQLPRNQAGQHHQRLPQQQQQPLQERRPRSQQGQHHQHPQQQQAPGGKAIQEQPQQRQQQPANGGQNSLKELLDLLMPEIAELRHWAMWTASMASYVIACLLQWCSLRQQADAAGAGQASADPTGPRGAGGGQAAPDQGPAGATLHTCIPCVRLLAGEAGSGSHYCGRGVVTWLPAPGCSTTPPPTLAPHPTWPFPFRCSFSDYPTPRGSQTRGQPGHARPVRLCPHPPPTHPPVPLSQCRQPGHAPPPPRLRLRVPPQQPHHPAAAPGRQRPPPGAGSVAAAHRGAAGAAG